MKFDIKKYLELVEKDFEEAWRRSSEVLSYRHLNLRYPRCGYEVGVEHPLFKTIQDLRRAYLSLGFREVVNPIIVEDVHVKKQFGKEALAILDRCFYLATLPRPDVGLSNNEIKKIEKIIEREVCKKEVEKLQKVFHLFKKGRICGDDLGHEIAKVLNIDDVTALKILNEVFPEMKPIPTNLTLRSHMTTDRKSVV